jgi:hypothetical protein
MLWEGKRMAVRVNIAHDLFKLRSRRGSLRKSYATPLSIPSCRHNENPATDLYDLIISS